MPLDDPRSDRLTRRSGRGGLARGPRPDIAADPEPDPVSVARTIALTLLTTAARSRGELQKRMMARGVTPEVATQVLDRFSEVGLIDDADLARTWVESRHRTRGLAGSVLAVELGRKGIDPETVADAVAGLDPDTERATARRLVERKVAATRGLQPQVRTRRLVGMLARKGYPGGLAFAVVREVLERDGEHSTDQWDPGGPDGEGG